MKRRDMLAALTGYLVDYKRYHPSIQYNAEDLANFVLECVERKGMDPPLLNIDDYSSSG